MATSVSTSTIKSLTPYIKLFVTRPFPTISHEWDEAESKKAPQRVHGDAKSSQSRDKTLKAQAFFTSHILYLRKSGGGGQRAIAFVEGREYVSSKVHWQVTLPEVSEKEVTDGKLGEIIKKAVKEAFLAAGGDEDGME